MAKKKAAAPDEDLSAKRELFCRYYTQKSDLFGNATLSYPEASPREYPAARGYLNLTRRNSLISSGRKPLQPFDQIWFFAERGHTTSPENLRPAHQVSRAGRFHSAFLGREDYVDELGVFRRAPSTPRCRLLMTRSQRLSTRRAPGRRTRP